MFIFLDIDGVLNKESDWSKPFSLSSDCIRRFCEKYREARMILISSWKNGFISSHNEKNMPQIKELEAQLDRYGIRIVGKVCDNRYRDYAVRDYLKEHPSIKEYVVAAHIRKPTRNISHGANPPTVCASRS